MKSFIIKEESNKYILCQGKKRVYDYKDKCSVSAYNKNIINYVIKKGSYHVRDIIDRLETITYNKLDEKDLHYIDSKFIEHIDRKEVRSVKVFVRKLQDLRILNKKDIVEYKNKKYYVSKHKLINTKTKISYRGEVVG